MKTKVKVNSVYIFNYLKILMHKDRESSNEAEELPGWPKVVRIGAKNFQKILQRRCLNHVFVSWKWFQHHQKHLEHLKF